MRPMAIRPTYGEWSSVEMSIWNGPSGLARGGGKYSTMVSKSASSVRSVWARSARSLTAQPSRPDAYRKGASSCSWPASRSMKSSRTSSCTCMVRASARSTLLTTTTGSRPSSSALRVTKRVCGMGPSAASTRIRTPSTMRRIRSTSPPKSAWPGVSTMLILTPFQWTAVFLARMVMPRSRSSGFESIARSCTAWLARKIPDWRNIWSTRVVLPWSTWAMMATLRMFIPRLPGVRYSSGPLSPVFLWHSYKR